MIVIAAARGAVRRRSSRWKIGPASSDGMSDETVTLWRPTGPEELALVKASGWTAWPPRLPEQPIFYPVLNEAYAHKIAREWNVKASGVGFVTRFESARHSCSGTTFSKWVATRSSSTGSRPKTYPSSTPTSLG